MKFFTLSVLFVLDLVDFLNISVLNVLKAV